MLAELGALHLARREYTESLDTLLRSGYWMDAAYVAERVLTLDELGKSYVDRHWPAVAPASNASTNVEQVLETNSGTDVRRELRHLLGRRLTRMERGNEAREYYPPDQQADFDTLLQNLMVEGDARSASGQRAAALFVAAKLVREHGMELIGTEVEPDWHIHGGQFAEGVTISSRPTRDSGAVLFTPATRKSISAQQHEVDP